MDEATLAPVSLSQVEVTDGYCKNALKKEADYLLSLSAGRLVAGFYENAGLKAPYVRYGGWESGLMGGHTLGHYLTALAQGASGPALHAILREELKERARQIVYSLSECQNFLGSGLIWGAPPMEGGIEAQFDNVERGKTDIKTEAWVPWYTLHKIMAGLLDVHRLLRSPLALEVAGRLGDWVYARAGSWTEEVRRQVLSVEYGGMNDCLYELYSFTGEEEHALAAHIFDEEELFDLILTEGKDVLDDLHANTTVPKILGALNRYLTLHGKVIGGKKIDASRYLAVAQSFFRMVNERHTYVTGGSSEWERFGRDYVLDAERTNCNCETCVTYNMMKLAQRLFCVTGDRIYSDYYDNAFTNNILSSQDPETGMTTYFQPMASGYFKVFSTPEHNFWCCTGSGMENFTKLGEGIYYRKGKNLFLERYLSSRLSGEIGLELRANFPFDSTAHISVIKAAEPFLLCLRAPDWAAGEITAKKNGAKVKLLEGSGHVSLAVKEGDELELYIPVEVTLKGLPDGKDAFAFRYGGAALSADLGREDMAVTTTGEDVTIPAEKRGTDAVYFGELYPLFEDPSRFLVREGENFRLEGGDIPLRFGLHYKRYKERYALYVRLREGKRPKA